MGSTRNNAVFEAAWWTPYSEADHFRNFGSIDDAMQWLRDQAPRGVHEWLIRRRSTDGWRTVASGTAADLRA